MKSELKKIIVVMLFMAMNINSFATGLSDNDGSAFITKAEFDTLRATFDEKIQGYEFNIDSTIDNAISQYLSGIKIGSRDVFKIATELSWPLKCKYGSVFTDYTNKLKTHYDAASIVLRGVYSSFFKHTFDNSLPLYTDNYYVIDGTTNLALANSNNVQYQVKFMNYGYTFDSSIANFYFLFFYNGSAYDAYDGSQHNSCSSMSFNSNGFKAEKILYSRDDLGIVTNYMFRLGNFTLSNLTWKSGTWNSSNSWYKDEMGTGPTKFSDASMEIVVDQENLNIVTNTSDTVFPVVYRDNNGDIYTYVVLRPSDGYPQINSQSDSWKYWDSSGVHTSNSVGVNGVVWPSYSLFDQTHAGATTRDWNQCSGVKAADIQYQLIDTSTGISFNHKVCDGIYLGTAKDDGVVTIELYYSDTGSNDKRVVFHKAPIVEDGSSASISDVYDFNVGKSTSTVNSDTFAGTELTRNYTINDVKKGDRIYMKTFCDQDFTYTKRPAMYIIRK